MVQEVNSAKLTSERKLNMSRFILIYDFYLFYFIKPKMQRSYITPFLMTARFRVPSCTKPFFLRICMEATLHTRFRSLPSFNLETNSYTDSQIVNELIPIIIPSGIERINKVNAVIYTGH